MEDPAQTRDDVPTRTATAGDSDTHAPAVAIDAARNIGRFAVLGPLGAGGMGQVFSAYDPQLDRRVALKLLHGQGDPTERQRLVREAQALARLAHPNVVAVHEVGTHDEHLFVAMEFVDGVTLRAWMDANPPVDASPSRHVRALEILRDAARGIEAAHAAGLVHRDVKPSNILVGNDGRVRVVDFGLARTERGDPEDLATTVRSDTADPLEVSRDDEGRAAALLAAPLTRTGKIIGTPAYMAPEQFHGGPLDHTADQFAFCVMAWEVLFGVRPFHGTPIAILVAIREGKLERPPRVEIAPALETALRRGLAYRATRRHADMTAVLAVIEDALADAKGERRPARGLRPRWWVAGGAGALATVAVLSLMERDAVTCDGAAEQFVGVWDAPRREQIRHAIFATEAAFASTAWRNIETNVDAWRARWEAGHRDACEAARIRGEQSPRLLDLRMACLDARRQRLIAYLDLLANPTVETLASAEDAFASLPPIEQCADVEYVEHRGRRSEDPAIAAIEDAVLADVASATALQAAGDPEGALAIAEQALAREQGSDLARAHALFVEADALAVLYRPDEAFAATTEAYRLARLTGTEEIAAKSSRLASRVAGVSLLRLEHARWWGDIALVEAERSRDDAARASALLAHAEILERSGRLEEARTTLQDVVTMAVLDRHRQSDALARLGLVESGLGDFDVGLGRIHQAISSLGELLGPDHPELADLHAIAATALLMRAELDEAWKSASRAIDISRAAYGPGHIATYSYLDAAANVAWERGDAEATLALMREARSVHRPTALPSVIAARIAAREGETLFGMGRSTEAIAAFRDALELSSAELGAWDPHTALYRVQLAQALAYTGETSEALQLVDAALASNTVELGTHSELIIQLHDYAAATLDRAGQLDRAVAEMRTAVRLGEAFGRNPTPSRMRLYANLCGILRRTELHAEAIAACQTAWESADALPGLAPSTLASLHNTMGAAFADAGRLEDARAHYAEGLRLHDRAVGSEDMMVAILLANIAELDLRAGDFHEALRGYTRSLALRERLTGTSSAALVVPLRGIADVRLRTGERQQSIAAAERAVQLADAANLDALERGLAASVLARALWLHPSRRRQARATAVRAMQTLAEAGARGLAASRELEAWLAATSTPARASRPGASSDAPGR